MKDLIQTRPFVAAETPGKQDAVEMVEFVLLATDKFQEAKADGGGINWKDTPKLFSLLDPASVAFDGTENIDDFFRDAPADELQNVLDHLDGNMPFAVDRETFDKAQIAAVAVYDLARHLARKKAANGDATTLRNSANTTGSDATGNPQRNVSGGNQTAETDQHATTRAENLEQNPVAANGERPGDERL